MHRRGSDGGGGIPAERFQDERGESFSRIDLAELFFGLEEQFAVGHRQHFFDPGQGGAAQKGLLQQALAICQAYERLGMQLAGNRPQPGTCSAAKNYRD